MIFAMLLHGNEKKNIEGSFILIVEETSWPHLTIMTNIESIFQQKKKIIVGMSSFF